MYLDNDHSFISLLSNRCLCKLCAFVKFDTSLTNLREWDLIVYAHIKILYCHLPYTKHLDFCLLKPCVALNLVDQFLLVYHNIRFCDSKVLRLSHFLNWKLNQRISVYQWVFLLADIQWDPLFSFKFPCKISFLGRSHRLVWKSLENAPFGISPKYEYPNKIHRLHGLYKM